MTEYTYDNLDRLDTVLDEGKQVAGYEFNVDGTIKSLAYNNGINISYNYDLNKNITGLINSNAQGDILSSFEYTYDNNGNQLTKLENGQTTTYTYDELNRLKTALYPELGLETYTYDNTGNRKSKVLGAKTTTYNYDSNNRLIQSAENGIITAYSYDNNGNLLEEAVNGAKTLYIYDGFNKLTETVKPDGKWLHNEYSAEGFRVATEENGFSYNFVFDRGNIITELNANTQQVTRSIRGIGLIGQVDNKGNLNYYLNNAHGDVVSLVDAGGQVLNSYQYDAFGNTTNYAEKVANRFMYVGEQFDRTTGQYYLRARYYNPVVGRFIQEDTYRGDGLNLYAYVANNPVKYIDPSGHYYIVYNEEDDMYLLARDNFISSALKSVSSLIPKIGDLINAGVERSIFHVVGGNSATSDVAWNKSILSDIAEDAIKSGKGVLAKNMAQYIPIISYAADAYSTYDTFTKSVLDAMSFDLMVRTNTAVESKCQSNLERNMNVSYEFIAENSDYFRRDFIDTKSLYDLDELLSKAKDPYKIANKWAGRYRGNLAVFTHMSKAKLDEEMANMYYYLLQWEDRRAAFEEAYNEAIVDGINYRN